MVARLADRPTINSVPFIGMNSIKLFNVINVGRHMSLANLADYRNPVKYTIRLIHHWDDSLEILVENISDDSRSRHSAGDAMMRAGQRLIESAK